MVTNNEAQWILSIEEREIWWLDKDYEWYYNILYKGLEQLIPLGAIPLAILVYYNARIYSAIKRPPNIELQADEEIASINREKRLSKVLVVIVFVFNVCHTPRIIWYVYNAYIYKNIVNCPIQYPNTTGQSFWVYVFGLIYDLFLVINASVNTIVYCAINERFRYYLFSFITAPFKKLVRVLIPAPSPSSV
jgi:hypothetical protein